MQWMAQTTAGYKLFIIVHIHTHDSKCTICTRDQLKFSCLVSPSPTHRVFYARCIQTQIKSRTKHVNVNKIFGSTTTTKCHT